VIESKKKKVFCREAEKGMQGTEIESSKLGEQGGFA
jgi:hypothetical protein